MKKESKINNVFLKILGIILYPFIKIVYFLITMFFKLFIYGIVNLVVILGYLRMKKMGLNVENIDENGNVILNKIQ